MFDIISNVRYTVSGNTNLCKRRPTNGGAVKCRNIDNDCAEWCVGSDERKELNMTKYFRTLLKLFYFFLEDDFLFIGYQKDNFYYPAVKLSRQLLKKHILEPFSVVKTLEVNSDYASKLQSWVPMRENNISNSKMALSERLWDFGFKATDVVFKNGVISSFTYTYN